jgi:hypothetical protein
MMDKTNPEDDHVSASESENYEDATTLAEQPARQKQNLCFKALSVAT